MGQKGFCNFQQDIFVSGLCPKAEMIAEGSENLHAAFGKAFGRGEGIGDRQLQHKICAAVYRSFCPCHLVYDGRHTPLHIIATHKAHDATIGIRFAHCIQLLFMTQVQRVIFANDTGDFQNNPPFLKNFPFQGLRILENYYRIDLAMAILS